MHRDQNPIGLVLGAWSSKLGALDPFCAKIQRSGCGASAGTECLQLVLTVRV